MSTFIQNGVVDTTKIFSNIIKQGTPGLIGETGPVGPPGGIGPIGPIGPPGPANTSNISLSQTTVDLSVAQTIIDDNIGQTFITVRSKPGSPQYTKTILLGQIPINAHVEDYMVLFTIGGQNTGMSDDNLNYHLTVNGVEISDADATIAVPSGANPYWATMGIFAVNAISAGDVLGIKLWTDASDFISFDYATFYVVPRSLAIPAGFQTISNGSNYTNDEIDGAVSGVVYVGVGPQTIPAFYDISLGEVIVGSPTLQSFVATFATPLKVVHAAVYLAAAAYAIDVNHLVDLGPASAASLIGVIPQSLVRYIQIYDFIVGAPAAGTYIYTPLIGTINGTDGFDGNAVFTLPQVPIDFNQLNVENQIQQIFNTAYTYALVMGVGKITFNPGYIPRVGQKPMAGYTY